MRKTLLLAVLPGTLFFFSCKKDNQTASSGALPKTYTEDVRSSAFNTVVTYNLSYDANNRLISLAAIPEPSITKFIYQYPAANLYTMDLYNSNTLSVHEILWLNSSSFLDSTYQYNNTGDTTTEKYVYNAARQLVETRSYIYSHTGTVPDVTTDYEYDATGNAVKMSDDAGNTTTYTYYPDLANTFSMGKTYIPQPKNFIKTATLTAAGSTETTTHFYTFDGSNRLVKDSSSISGVNVIAIKSYTY